MKFKVGDFVIGNEQSKEEYTRLAKGRMLLGQVVHVYGSGNVKIQIINSTKAEDIGLTYSTTDLHCFDLTHQDPFEAYLRGQISEEQYRERVK